MSKNNLAPLPPFVQGRSIENSRWYMGNVITFLVNREQTGGAFSMTEYLSKPGNEPPSLVMSEYTGAPISQKHPILLLPRSPIPQRIRRTSGSSS